MNILRLAVITVFFAVLPFSHIPAFAASYQKVKVFACEPEWAALAQEIGGDKVEAFSATSATQNPHYIRARPSLISKVRKADLLICSGASLEVGWLPVLLKKASSDLQPGSPGYIMAANLVTMLEVPVAVDRSMGDVHPEGNPHLHLNPYNLIIVGEVLADAFRKSTLGPPLFTKTGSRIFHHACKRPSPGGNPRPPSLKGSRWWFITNRLVT